MKKILLVPLALILASVALRPVAVVAHNSFIQPGGPSCSVSPVRVLKRAARRENPKTIGRVSALPHQFRTLEKQTSNEEALVSRVSKINRVREAKAPLPPVLFRQPSCPPRFLVLRI